MTTSIRLYVHCLTYRPLSISIEMSLTLLKRVTYHCVIDDLCQQNRSLYVQYRISMSPLFPRNFEANASEFLENSEEMLELIERQHEILTKILKYFFSSDTCIMVFVACSDLLYQVLPLGKGFYQSLFTISNSQRFLQP